MIYIKVVLALMTAFTLLSFRIEEGGDVGSKPNPKHMTSKIVKMPPKELLEIEKKWENLKSQKNQMQVVVEEVEVKSGTSFLIDGVEYELMGIFQQNSKKFIVLKNGESDLLKLSEGDKLSSSSFLMKINLQDIEVRSGEEVLKLKLFERKKYETN